MATKFKGFISKISGRPGSGQATVTYRSGVVSSDLRVGQFFMKMQDEGRRPSDIAAYVNIGPMIDPSVDWTEVGRIASSFR